MVINRENIESMKFFWENHPTKFANFSRGGTNAVQLLVAMFCQTKPGEFTNERCLRCLMVKIPSVDPKKSPIIFCHLARHHLA